MPVKGRLVDAEDKVVQISETMSEKSEEQRFVWYCMLLPQVKTMQSSNVPVVLTLKTNMKLTRW